MWRRRIGGDEKVDGAGYVLVMLRKECRGGDGNKRYLKEKDSLNFI